MNNHPVQLFDWNQSLGTMLVALLFLAVTGYVIYDPSFLTEDDRPLLYLAVFAGPFIGAWGLWRTVFWLEIGDTLCFQRIYGKRRYTWEQVSHLHLDTETTRFVLGLIKVSNRYLEFTITNNGTTTKHRFRVTKSTFPKVASQIVRNRPDLIETAT